MRRYAADGHAVLIYCTEIPEVFEAADLVYVVSDGRLSDPAPGHEPSRRRGAGRAVTRLERHSLTPAASAATPA